MLTLLSKWRKWLAALVAALTITSGVVIHTSNLSPGPVQISTALFPTYAGIDLPGPSNGIADVVGCPIWSYFKASCYLGQGSNAISFKAEIASDIAFIKANGLGKFQRLWISLDQLFSCFDATTGYCGYDNAALGNVDDALGQYADAGIKLDIVLLTNSNSNGFHAEALDGFHDTMRSNYLVALSTFMHHIANNAKDSKAVIIADILNEAYFQMDSSSAPCSPFGCITNPILLASKWAFSEDPGGTNACEAIGNTICNSANAGSDGHGCENQSHTAVVGTCVDVNIVYPFLVDEYNTVKAAAPNVLFEASDTRRLLTTSVAQFTSQAFEETLYPFDIYDIHLYDDTPWSTTATARYVTGLTLHKQWFSGEVGCSPGNNACTYDGTNAAPVDNFWLGVAGSYGCKSLLIEAHQTIWTNPSFGSGVIAYTRTLTGGIVAHFNGAR